MRRFEFYKTIQLVLYLVITAAALVTVFRDKALYAAIASDPHVRLLALLLWLGLGASFVFMFIDFGSYTDLKRENTELDQAVRADALTGVANRYSCDAYIGQYLDRQLPENMACVTLDLINLKEINALAGHRGGDEAIKVFSDVLMESFREGSAGGKKRRRSTEDGGAGQQEFFIGRNGGNKFLVIVKDSTPELVEFCLKNVEDRIPEHPVAGDLLIRYEAGTAFAAEAEVGSITDLVALSDRRAQRG